MVGPEEAGLKIKKEELPALLEGMLAPIRRSRDTPLQFDIDSRRLVEAALANFLPGDPDSIRGQDLDWENLVSALNSLVETTLLPENRESGVNPAPIDTRQPVHADPGNVDEEASLSPERTASHPLAAWLDSLFTVMRNVDHRAFEILSLRLDGFRDRDIAEKLETGLRLVVRITREMRSNWKVASGRN